MKLLTEFYVAKSKIHFDEIVDCILKNEKLDVITGIYLFVNEEDYEIAKYLFNIYKKIVIVLRKVRPTFTDLFDYSCIFSDEIIIICNSDIHFDSSLEIINLYDLSGKFVLLNRYEKNSENFLENDKLYEVPYSQDAWIFRSGTRLTADFKLGTLGCDNKIGYIAFMSGYNILNPSKIVKSYHCHKESERFYCEKVLGPYLLSWPVDNMEESNTEIITTFDGYFS